MKAIKPNNPELAPLIAYFGNDTGFEYKVGVAGTPVRSNVQDIIALAVQRVSGRPPIRKVGLIASW